MAGKPLSVAVIGGGIGGLAAALSLLRVGLDVHVYEQARELSDIGAGLQISPNASRLLRRLGIVEALDINGVRPVGVHQRRWDDGRTLQRAPLGPEIEAAFGAPYYHFHRADLVGVLAAAMPPGRVHVGHRLREIDDLGERVVATFENGARIEVDALVGADGIHSRVRHCLYGPDKPRFTGCVAWRGLVPADKIAHLDLEVVSSNWMGPGGHFVHYWVSGRTRHNFVAIVERDSWTAESWTDRGDIEEVRALYAGWHPIVRTLLGSVEETFIWALHDRPALPRWSTGRCTLLGDACHPMLPMMAQGAAQAIEDGAALASCLTQGRDDVVAALARYEGARKARATRLQDMSAGNRVRFHYPDGPDQIARDAAMAAGGDRSITNIGWLYGHDPAAIGESPPT